MSGGLGNDTFVFRLGDGFDHVMDFTAGDDQIASTVERQNKRHPGDGLSSSVPGICGGFLPRIPLVTMRRGPIYRWARRSAWSSESVLEQEGEQLHGKRNPTAQAV